MATTDDDMWIDVVRLHARAEHAAGLLSLTAGGEYATATTSRLSPAFHRRLRYSSANRRA